MNASEALEQALRLPNVSTVLDVGSGDGIHAATFKEAGKMVNTISLVPPATFITDYLQFYPPDQYDLVWASHVLEHQPNPNYFLKKCFSDLKVGGWLCVTVPPAKNELVGGHVTIWNEAVLLYQLVLAGFDCSQAKVKRYGYNISVIVQKKPFNMPSLVMDCGDIQKLEAYLPRLKHGDVPGVINWDE